MSDPFKTIIDNVYIEYSKSNIRFDPYWRLKMVHCPVCESDICYPRGHAHRHTKKHVKNLMLYIKNNS